MKSNSVHVLSGLSQYPTERHLLMGKRLQACVWHSRTLNRKVFLGEVLLPLDGLRCENEILQGFNWYPLCPKVKDNNITMTVQIRQNGGIRCSLSALSSRGTVQKWSRMEENRSWHRPLSLQNVCDKCQYVQTHYTCVYISIWLKGEKQRYNLTVIYLSHLVRLN